MSQDIKCLFIHDFKYLKFEGKVYGDSQFEYKGLWKKKYLNLFGSLTVLARGNNTTNQNDVRHKSILSGDNIRFVPTESLAAIGKLSKIKSVKETIEAEIATADMVIVRLPSIQGLIACYILNRQQKPYILRVVGSAFGSLWYHDKFKGKLIAPLIHALNKHYIKKAPNVIYSTNKYLQNLYPNSHNTIGCSDVLIGNIAISVLEKRIKKINKYDQDTCFKIGLIGPYGVPYKGHKVAIRSLSEILNSHDAELHFLGSGPRERLIKLSKKHGVMKKVRFDNPRSVGKEMIDWLDDTDILIAPSKTEGLPRAVLESMSRAGVIVASNAGDLPFILKKENILGKNDWRGFSQRILELVNDKEKMIETATQNFTKAKSFQLKVLSRKGNNFINKIIEDEVIEDAER